MRFLPVVERELRAASRRWATYWVRTWVALTVVGISAWIVLVNREDASREVGQILYYTITGGALLYCTLIGVRITSDCISEEKREGTLGLLFLTDLKGYDVVIGKLVANSVNGFYGLASVFPVVAMVLMMGGITGGQVARTATVLLNTMFFSVCMGIFASACSRSAKRAISFTLVLVMFFTGLIPAIGAWVAWKLELGSFATWQYAMWTTPGYSYLAAQELPIRLIAPNGFMGSLITVHAIAWVFLGLACIIAPHSWQDHPAGARKLRWRERLKNVSYGDAESRALFRRRLLDANAFFWLAARERLKPTWVWIFLGLTGCGWVWGLVKFKEDWLEPGIYIATAFVLNSVLKNWFAQEAARQLSEERNAGSLELLLSTSLTVKEILHGQALALRRQFFAPVVVVLIAEMMMMIAGAKESGGADRTMWIVCWVSIFMVMLVADLIAIYWVGMWMGLASKNPKRAYSDTIGRVLALPWIIFALFILLVVLFSAYRRSELTGGVIVGFAVGQALLVDVVFSLWARYQLLTEFREAATRRFQRSVPLWRRILGIGPADNEPTGAD